MASVDSVPVENDQCLSRRLSENLLLLEFRDGLRPARFAHGKCDFVASVQCIQHAVLHLELFGSSAGIGSDSAALRLLNGDGPTNPIDCGDRSRKRLLGQRHRTDDREHRTSQNHLCQSHRNPSAFEQSEISRNQRIGSLVGEFQIWDYIRAPRRLCSKCRRRAKLAVQEGPAGGIAGPNN